MRRTLAISTFIALSLAACGASDSATPVSLPPAEGAEAEAPETTVPEDLCVPVGGEAPEADLGDIEPPETNPDKPEVEIPAEAPTALERSVLVEGTGEAAEAGDTVIVDYAGVRSSDGLPFDNSYDRGQAFPVLLGEGRVIQGWDDGLLGAMTGDRLQLDIPSDQAYGETARSNIICENENLTFVIDVRAVVKAVDPGDVPAEPGVELSEAPGVDDTVFEDLMLGDGAALEQGDTVVFRYTMFNGESGEVIEDNWSEEPTPRPFTEGLLPGLLEGMDGMALGGRRALTVPPEDGFGLDGNPDAGLPAETDIILVVDLVAKY